MKTNNVELKEIARPAKQQAKSGVKPSASRKAGSGDLFDQIWHFFTLPRVALVLILLVAVGSLAGVLIMQAPESAARDYEAYRDFLGSARLKYGAWTDPLDKLGLLNIFQSFWFRTLVSLLIINILVCTINRWKSVWHPVRHPRVKMAPSFYKRQGSLSLSARSDAQPSDLALSFTSVLKRRGYRVKTLDNDSETYIYADKNWLGPTGTFLSHLGLVLLLAGALGSGLLGGFRESGFTVPVGSSKEVGRGTGLSVYVDNFADEYHLDGRPKDYRTEAVILENGQEVKRGTIRVNEPLEHNGVRFHQAFYGQAVSMRVEGSQGDVIYADNIPLAFQSNDGARPVGYISLPTKNLNVYFIGNGGPDDPLIAPGSVFLEAYEGAANKPTYKSLLPQKQPIDVAGLRFTFERELQFTGLQVVYDPTGYVVWLACALIVLGMVMVLYFPHRRLWSLSHKEEGRTTLVVLSLDNKEMSYSRELKELMENTRSQLSQKGLLHRGQPREARRGGRQSEALSDSSI